MSNSPGASTGKPYASSRHNNRLDRLPIWPHRRSTLISLASAFFFSYFEISALGPALPQVAAQFDVTIQALGFVGTASLLGYLPGTLLVGVLADWRGRRVALMLAVITYSIGTALSALSPGIAMFGFSRFLAGAGAGAAIAAVTTYVGELAPKLVRGRATGWTVLGAQAGSAFATLLALIFIGTVDWGWRAYLLLPALGSVALWLSWNKLPESPRWLVSKGRFLEAEDVVSDAERRVDARLGTSFATASDDDLSPVEPVAEAKRAKRPLKQTIALLFSPPYVRYTTVLFFGWFGIFFVLYTFATLKTVILVEIGFGLQTAIAFNFISVVGSLAGGYLLPLIADRVERKYLAAILTVALALLYLAFGLSYSDWLLVVTMIASAIHSAMFVSLMYTLTPEHFPTEVRSTGVAVTNGIGHLGGAVGPPVSAAVFAATGLGGLYITFTGVLLVVAALVVSLRKTRGKTIEELTDPVPSRT
jgi:putative MFS transporter